MYSVCQGKWLGLVLLAVSLIGQLCVCVREEERQLHMEECVCVHSI